jgi:hypothetical protein
VLKRAAPAWWWLRRSFTLPSVLTLAGILAGGASWIWSQHTAIRDLRQRVAGIEDQTPQLDKLSASIQAIERDQAATEARLVDFNRRVAAQEAEWQAVHQAADIRVPRRRPPR